MKDGDGDGAAFVGEERAGERGEECALTDGAEKPSSAEPGHVNVHRIIVCVGPGWASGINFERALDKAGGTGFFRGGFYQGKLCQ